MPVHPQSAQTSSIDDYAIPFSKALLLLEELGTGAELAIEAAQISLFDLEAPPSLHDDSSTETTRLEVPPTRGRALQERIATAMPIRELPPHAPALRRKPNGLVKQPIMPEKKSYRQLGLEALVLRLNAVGGSNSQPRLFVEQEKLCVARRKAVEALAQKGWDMRQSIPRGRERPTEKKSGTIGCAGGFAAPGEGVMGR